MTLRFVQTGVAALALLCTGLPAAAITVNGVEMSINVESDFNDWQWNFAVSVPINVHNEVRSFHVRGLPGDVSDTYEYEDFQPGHLVSPGWSVTTDKATGAINFTKSGMTKPLTSGGKLTFSFDSDYTFSDVPMRMFHVGLDFANDPTKIYWEKVTVPLPASALMLGGGMIGLGALARRRKGKSTKKQG